MKTYTLEITLDKEIAIHEKTSEGITTTEARILVGILEEYKNRLLTYITFSQDQKTIDLKKQTRQ